MPNVHKQNRFKTIFYFFFTLITILSFYQKIGIEPATIEEKVTVKEAYDPSLLRLQSLDDFDKEVRLHLKHDLSDTSKIVNTIDDILRNRFYHSYSEYSMRDNWIAYLCSKTLFWGIKHPVIPDDIMKYPMAACSQQGLVFQSMLERYKIRYATINMANTTESVGGHYAVSAFYNAGWHFFDSNVEPKKVKGNPSVEKLIQDNALVSLYPTRYQEWLEQKVAQNLITQSDINHKRGDRMYAFQYVTNILSAWLWLVMGVAWVVLILCKIPNFLSSFVFQRVVRKA